MWWMARERKGLWHDFYHHDLLAILQKFSVVRYLYDV